MEKDPSLIGPIGPGPQRLGSIDNETREPVRPQSFTIYRQDIYVCPGSKPDETRSVIVRTTGTLAPVTGHLGLSIGGVVEFFGQVAVPASDPMGRPMGTIALLFPIPVKSLYDAFAKLCDEPWVASAVRAAIAERNRLEAIASVRGGR